MANKVTIRPVEIQIPVSEIKPRTPGFVITRHLQEGRSFSLILTKDEAAQLAVDLTATLIGQAVYAEENR